MAQSSQKNLSRFLFILLAVFAAALIWLIADRVNTKKQFDQKLTQMHEVQLDLDTKYNEAVASLDLMRGENAELDALIEKQKEELKTQRNRIAGLIRSRKDLDQARVQLDSLNLQVGQYLEEIQVLREQNEYLATTNQELSAQKSQLSDSLRKESRLKEEVIAEATNLNKRNLQLEETTSQLSKKVNKASVLSVRNLEALPLEVKNGKEKKKRKADKVDMIDVCFEVAPNDLAEIGKETFYLRIIQPSGETMSISSKGSGVFTDPESGEDIRYTMRGSFDYQKSDKNLCIEWNPNVPFQTGEYVVELYNKGYLSGKTNLELK